MLFVAFLRIFSSVLILQNGVLILQTMETEILLQVSDKWDK